MNNDGKNLSNVKAISTDYNSTNNDIKLQSQMGNDSKRINKKNVKFNRSVEIFPVQCYKDFNKMNTISDLEIYYNLTDYKLNEQNIIDINNIKNSVNNNNFINNNNNNSNPPPNKQMKSECCCTIF